MEVFMITQSKIRFQRMMQQKLVIQLKQKALISIHSKGVLHRDIKSENILLRKPNLEDIVISDFGLAVYYNENGKYNHKRAGTPGNIAPEILKDQNYDYKVDVYGLGILLYQMLTKKSPFCNQNYEKLLFENQEGFIDYSKIKASSQTINLLIIPIYLITILKCQIPILLQDIQLYKQNKIKHSKNTIDKLLLLKERKQLKIKQSLVLAQEAIRFILVLVHNQFLQLQFQVLKIVLCSINVSREILLGQKIMKEFNFSLQILIKILGTNVIQLKRVLKFQIAKLDQVFIKE